MVEWFRETEMRRGEMERGGQGESVCVCVSVCWFNSYLLSHIFYLYLIK